VPAEAPQHARQDERVGAALRIDAPRPPAVDGTTGPDEFTIPAAGVEGDGITIATTTTAVGTVASG